MMRRDHLKPLFILPVYFLFAVLITWPLLPLVSTVIPIGTERTTTIPLFGLWSLLWNAEQIFDLFPDYWNAPIFYPAVGTFAFSETMLPQGLVFAAGLMLTGDPLPVYNLLLLSCLALNGLAAFSLLRRLGVSDFPAVIAGFMAVALPYAANEMGVCQLIVLFPILYFFSCFYQFSRSPRLQTALRMGVWGALVALSCSYYGLFLSIFAILGAVCLFDRTLFSFRPIAYLLGGVCLATLVVMPVLVTQIMITSGFSHGASINQLQSCRPGDYLALAPNIFGARFMPWLVGTGARHPMYPGTGLLFLAVLGFWFGRDKARRWVVFCVLGVALAMVLSMAGNIEFSGWNLMDGLKNVYPGFTQLRNAFRFGVFAQLFLLGLAGFALERTYRLHPRWGPLLVTAVFLLSLVEVLPITQLRPVPGHTFAADWSDFLATQPGGPAVMIPMAVEDANVDYNYLPIVTGMIHALHHEKPLVNGLSSFRPPEYLVLKKDMRRFPDPSSLAGLCRNRVAYVIVERSLVPVEVASMLPRHPQLALLYSDEMKQIYRLKCPETEP